MATTLQFFQLHAVLAKPLPIRMRLGQLLLDFAIVVNLTLLSVNQQNLSWLKAALADHVAWLKVHHAYLTGYHHHPLLRNRITTGAQTVPVKHSACIASVAE